MARRSNKSIANILTPLVPQPLSSSRNDDDLLLLERKITVVTEGFTTTKFCELILRDRNRLSIENALTVSDYIIAMKREINPRLYYKRNTIQFLAELSKTVGIRKKFIDFTRDDVLCYLDKCRKLENEDPLHKWIGSYNTKLVLLSRFFKWLHYPNVDDPEEEVIYRHLRENLITSLVLKDSKGKRSVVIKPPIYGHSKTIYCF
jgi:hypothetical protein